MTLQRLLCEETDAFLSRMEKAENLTVEDRLECYLKEVRLAESRILDLYDGTLERNEFKLVVSKANMEYVDFHLQNRCFALSKMFSIHCSDEEVQKIDKLNSRLFSLTQNLYHQAGQTFNRMIEIGMGEHELFEVTGALCYVANELDSILKYNDDDFYGSDFQRMIPLITLIDENLHGDLPIISCRLTKGNSTFDGMDDGTTWAEGFLCHPKLSHIIMCYATHVIVSHKGYSIPDYIRMNKFRFEVNTETQFGTPDLC